uniref:Cadherin domain-containing protein n=1 Tax=Plectus sambesii TaxID=2011161 RepID=A0A914UYB4_9BILA
MVAAIVYKKCNDKKDPRAPVITADRTLLELTIEVRDVNDNFPHFTQSAFLGGGVQGKTKLGDRVARIFATDADDSDAGQLRYEIKGRIRSEFDKGYLDTDRQSFIINNVTGDIISNLHFQDDWNGNFMFTVAVVDSAGHEDTATVTINLLGNNQQVELSFETSANSVWDNAAKIVRLLSEATSWNSTIDDVRMPPVGVADINQSKVLVHFLDPNNTVIPIDIALNTLDRPESVDQKEAKRQLIEVHKLKYAGHTPTLTTIGLSRANMAIYFGVAGIVGGLMLVMIVLMAVWSCQNRSYKRKLKAATTLAFGTADPTVSAYDVPGTNLHATSNPVWMSAYETYGV